ncbi:MAG: matrixin family metalloprotease [bacterium]|nr:matrixin family metalloprotease [bacterium]
MRTPWIIAAAALLAAGAAPARAEGGRTLLRWGGEEMPIPYYIERGGAGDILDGSDIEAIQSAFQTWEHVATGRVEFQFAGLIDAAAEEEIASVVMWLDEEWPYDSSFVAKTRLSYDPRDGRILRAEILLNGRDYRWSTDGDSGALDVQNVATHEVGHFIGLRDSAAGGQAMFEYILLGETGKRYLSDADIDGVRANYPLAGRDGRGEIALRVLRAGAAAGEHPTGIPAERFTGICALGPARGPGQAAAVVSARDGEVAVSVIGPGGEAAGEYAIPAVPVHPGRIRAVSALDVAGDGIRSAIAALARAPEGLDVWIATTGRSIRLPVRGAEDVTAFAPLPPGEPPFGDAVAVAGKRRSGDVFVSIVRPRADAAGGITLEPLRSWSVPGSSGVRGIAVADRVDGGSEIVLLSRTPAGGFELLSWLPPFSAFPLDGRPFQPDARAAAAALTAGGNPLGIAAVHGGSPAIIVPVAR